MVVGNAFLNQKYSQSESSIGQLNSFEANQSKVFPLVRIIYNCRTFVDFFRSCTVQVLAAGGAGVGIPRRPMPPGGGMAEVLDLRAPEELRLGAVPGPQDPDGIDIEE